MFSSSRPSAFHGDLPHCGFQGARGQSLPVLSDHCQDPGGGAVHLSSGPLQRLQPEECQQGAHASLTPLSPNTLRGLVCSGCSEISRIAVLKFSQMSNRFKITKVVSISAVRSVVGQFRFYLEGILCSTLVPTKHWIRFVESSESGYLWPYLKEQIGSIYVLSS